MNINLAISLLLVGVTIVLAILIKFSFRLLSIIQRGLSLGDWAVSPSIFAYVVFISGITALLMPIILRGFMKQGFEFRLKRV